MSESAVRQDRNGSSTPTSSSTPFPNTSAVSCNTDMSGAPGNTDLQYSVNQEGSSQANQIHAPRASGPPTKKSKTSDFGHVLTPKKMNPMSKLAIEVKIMIFENLDADSLLAVWRTSPELYQVFYTDHGLKLWNELREASGLAIPKQSSQRPTHDELRLILYVLDDLCDVSTIEFYRSNRIELELLNTKICGSSNASHQWQWGTRRCGGCLAASLTTRTAFIENYRGLFVHKRTAFEAIGWYNPIDISGLQFHQMATNHIDAPPWEKGHFVASRRLANFAVETVRQLERERPKRSEGSMDEEAKKLILTAQHSLKYLLDPISEFLYNGSIELAPLRKNREKQIVDGLLQIKSLKMHKDDIPSTTNLEWRSLAYKGIELTAREWHEIKASLSRLVKTQRTARFLTMLEDRPPPTPATLRAPGYSDLENVASITVGILPASVFLEVCANADLDTMVAIERSSKLVRNLLRSRAADPAWRAIKASLGLNVCFENWPEREFLAYAVRRRCSYCPQEGLNIPLISLVLCGDCFEKHVCEMDNKPKDLLKNVVRAMPYIQIGQFVGSGWMDGCKKGTKLYQKGYVASLTSWIKGLPAAIKAGASHDLVLKHVANCTESFIKVAKACQTWQNSRDEGNLQLMDRRGQAIIRQAEEHQHVLGIPGHVFQSEGWKSVAHKAYPLSRKEWNLMKEYVLEMFRRDQVLGGVRVANIR
ncbi:hypothetical protein FRC01_011069 [Tulasnella sp. 417]|nr:hypothetical protein FRC01_011069 [Tulasnella sp. 417]